MAIDRLRQVQARVDDGRSFGLYPVRASAGMLRGSSRAASRHRSPDLPIEVEGQSSIGMANALALRCYSIELQSPDRNFKG
jgi:hypothetical protein